MRGVHQLRTSWRVVLTCEKDNDKHDEDCDEHECAQQRSITVILVSLDNRVDHRFLLLGSGKVGWGVKQQKMSTGAISVDE